MIMLYPYGYICVNNKICTIIHIYSKVQEKCGFNEIILFMHSLITQMYEQLLIYIRKFNDFYIKDILMIFNLFNTISP